MQADLLLLQVDGGQTEVNGVRLRGISDEGQGALIAIPRTGVVTAQILDVPHQSPAIRILSTVIHSKVDLQNSLVC